MVAEKNPGEGGGGRRGAGQGTLYKQGVTQLTYYNARACCGTTVLRGVTLQCLIKEAMDKDGCNIVA